jgi:hypothetical protein
MRARARMACALCVVAGVIATIGLTGCASGSGKVVGSGQPASQSVSVPKQPGSVTASDVVTAFTSAGLPVGKVEVYDASTDSNQLLGRPGQYVAKFNFADTRLEQPEGDMVGGSVETFKSAEDLKTRQAYIAKLAKQLSLAVEYEYTDGLMLLRLDKALTPDQAAAYDKAFQAVGK